jgi:WD40 repeat protein
MQRIILGLLAIAAVHLSSSAARCEDQPFLMLDTGGHQASIRGITFTPDGKYLVSAGYDKVVRVWDWRAGKTIRTIRGEVGSGYEGEAPVGNFQPNAFGLFDMHGNADQLVEDCWHDNYRGAPTDGSAWTSSGHGNCNRHVVRGGSWVAGPEDLRAARRLFEFTRESSSGFRVARTLSP